MNASVMWKRAGRQRAPYPNEDTLALEVNVGDRKLVGKRHGVRSRGYSSVEQETADSGMA